MAHKTLKGFSSRLLDRTRTMVAAAIGRNFDNTSDWDWQKPGAGRVASVGWVLDTPKSHFMWDAPRRVTISGNNRSHAKSVSQCPAVIDFDARLWEIPCPFDLRLGFGRNQEGRPILTDLDGDRSGIRGRYLQQLVTMAAEKEWRDPARPVIQIATPYIFIADEPVWMSQTAPFASRPSAQWPGLVLGGRMPIHIWPRQLLWAFEWWDTSSELRLVRGDPWFYLQFETHDPSRRVRTIEAALTPALRAYLDGTASVTNYMNRTFSLFRTAQERRPRHLLIAAERNRE